MGFISEFKKFAMRGNVLDLAVAVIIGGAFGKIVSSFVNDVIMPIVGLAMGGVDFKKEFIALDGGTYESLEAAKEAGVATLTYGNFIQTVIDFVIIALCIFMVIKAYERSKKKEEPAPAAPKGPTQEELLTEIRDLLKQK